MPEQPAHDVVSLHPEDNVCVTVRPLLGGTEIAVAGHRLRLSAPVPAGHKIAVRPIPAGAGVLKYGQMIGHTTQDVAPGDWVHTHNVRLGDLALDYAPASQIPAPPEPICGRTFQGYRRADGKAGTRNYLAVISTVNCSATVARCVARRFDAAVLRNFPHVDGVLAFRHSTGCGMEFGGLGHETLNRVLAGIARHPNIAGYLLIGLGCEQGSMQYLLDSQRLVQLDGAAQPSAGPPVLVMQDLGGGAEGA
jgi:altronate hydrolase